MESDLADEETQLAVEHCGKNKFPSDDDEHDRAHNKVLLHLYCNLLLKSVGKLTFCLRCVFPSRWQEVLHFNILLECGRNK